MALHSFVSVQKIPASPQEVWDFFASHTNLSVITPPAMKFRVISRHHGERIYAGQLIEYKVRPVMGIPVYWMTEITQVEELKYFVDVQRKGPYSYWQHQHHFKAIPGGVEMTDIVHYRNPFWVVGRIANVLFVRKKLHQIFEYRRKKIEEVFGTMNQ